MPLDQQTDTGRMIAQFSRRIFLPCAVAPLLAALLLVAPPAAAAERSGDSKATARRSIVRIVATSNPASLSNPWRRHGTQTSTGSGVIIEGRRILTAAHVIDDAVMIEVQRDGSPRRYTARAEFVCDPCDLALLSVSDAEFFEESAPLQIGGLPPLETPVDVYGFPLGGEGLSVTSGIFSRIEVDEYLQSGRLMLLAQIDAAINYGNSGGPAISGGKISGIAIQGLQDAENIGYIVPTPVIRHFLEDIEDGRFDGFPELDVWVQALPNPALRQHLGADPSQGGVLVIGVSESGSASRILQPGDVLLAIGDSAIGEDDTVELAPGMRVGSTALVHRAQVGETLTVRYLRDGVLHEAPLVMRRPSSWAPLGDYDRDLRYRVYGGLVFRRLTARYLYKFEEIPSHLWNYYSDPVVSGYRTLLSPGALPGRRELIVISDVLAGELNRGYEHFEDEVVHSIDGVPVRDLRHLSELLDSAQGKFVTLTTKRGGLIALNRGEVQERTGDLLARYGVPADRLGDLAVPAKSAPAP
jgi:S1-C subfamily serine protease